VKKGTSSGGRCWVEREQVEKKGDYGSFRGMNLNGGHRLGEGEEEGSGGEMKKT